MEDNRERRHVIHRGYRYRLYPSPTQEAIIRQFAGGCRFLYNLALEHREREWTGYRDNGTTLNYFQQSKELTQLRADVEWMAAIPRDCQEAALHDLDRAYSNFFAGRGKYPTYRHRGVGDSFRFKGRTVPVRIINGRWAEVRLQQMGWVRFRLSRPLRGEVKTVTIILDSLGWHVTFACAIEVETTASTLPSVGIDRGVAQTVAMSTGEFMLLPKLSKLSRQVARSQRTLARRLAGSRRQVAAKQRVARLRARVARIRKDWLHRASTSVARRFGTVVIEDLKILHLTASGPGGKRGLNRSILEQGWGTIATMLDYKLAERGGHLIRVNPAYTSQTCSCCGTIDKQSRESQARFVCRSCGFEAHADTNAAINILRRSTASMRAEDGESPAVEARTRSGNAAENQALAA